MTRTNPTKGSSVLNKTYVIQALVDIEISAPDFLQAQLSAQLIEARCEEKGEALARITNMKINSIKAKE